MKIVLGLLMLLLPSLAHPQQWWILDNDNENTAVWGAFAALFHYRLVQYSYSGNLRLLAMSCLRDSQVLVYDFDRHVNRDWEQLPIANNRFWNLQEIGCNVKNHRRNIEGFWQSLATDVELWTEYSTLNEYKLVIARPKGKVDATVFLLNCKNRTAKVLAKGEKFNELGGTLVNEVWKHYSNDEFRENRTFAHCFP